MDDPHAQPVHDEYPTDLDLEILDLLCKEAHSAKRLTETLSQGGEQVGVDAVRGHLEGLASHGLARPSEEAAHHADEAEADELVIAEEADQLWEITEEGRAVVVEPHSRVARAPYDLDVGNDKGDDDNRDVAGLVVLLLIALVTGACATYTLLTATGVLGGG
jgi:hypothetical protein